MLSIVINNKKIGDEYIKQLKSKCKHVFILDNNTPPTNQVLAAKACWRFKDLEDNIAVITYSTYFIKEINSLILLLNLDKDKRSNLLKQYSEYKEEYFSNRLLNISCFDLNDNEYCALNEFGFEVKSFDRVIDRQNNLQEAIIWGA